MTYPIPPPLYGQTQPNIVFVAKVILSAVAVGLVFAIMMALPPAARLTLAAALGVGAAVGIPTAVMSRRRRHAPSPDQHLAGTGESTSWRVSGVVAAISTLLILLAFLVPPTWAVSLSVVGLAGLFLVRLNAFHPRGAWRPPAPRVDLSARRLHPTLYIAELDEPGARRRDLVARSAAARRRRRRHDRFRQLQTHATGTRDAARRPEAAPRGGAPSLDGAGPPHAS